MNELFQNICVAIAYFVLIIIVLGLFIIACIIDDKTKKMKEEFASKLNEHDKSLILDYINTKFHFNFKKKKSNIEKLIDEEINK